VAKKALLFIIFLWCIYVLSQPTLAQQRAIHFKHLSLNEGLSQNSVFSMLQDQKGFLWFGTQDGLNKYDGYHFTVYKPDPDDTNSLSFNWINSLFEDDRGRIWIGTNGEGVNIFEPQTETFFRFPVVAGANAPSALNNGYVTCINQDANGAIWVATRNGLDRLTWLEDRREKKQNQKLPIQVTHYRSEPGKPDSIGSNDISSIYLGRKGTLWIGTTNDGLKKFNPDKQTFTHYRHDPGNASSLGDNRVTSICEDNSGMFWVSTYNGLYYMDRKSGTFYGYRHVPSDPASLSSNHLNQVYEDQSGIIWIATQDQGLCRFNKRTETFTRHQREAGNPFSLNNNTIFTIFEDRSRVLWLATNGGGLNRFDREDKFNLYRADPNTHNSLNDSFIYSVCEDHQGILWIGTNNGGLNRLDRRTGSFKAFLHEPGNPRSLGANTVRWLYESPSHILWVGTQGGGLNRFHRDTQTFSRYTYNPYDLDSIGSNVVRGIQEDLEGTLWIATAGGGLNKFNAETETFTRYTNNPTDQTSISENQVYVIYEAPSEPGIIWVGTLNQGLNRFDARRETAHRFPANLSDPHSLSYDTILAIHEDKAGTLWIGTYGGGLNKMIRKEDGNHWFIHYTEKHGLANNSIYGILEDDQGHLWISTNRGISRFEPKTGRFKNYNVRDGLQGNEFNAGAYFKNSQGEMFFGGLTGLNSFFPFQLKDNPHIPAVVLTGFKLFNKPVAIGAKSLLKNHITWTNELRLNYRQNAFSFQFSALDYTIPEKNLYLYKMDGLEEQWNSTSFDQRVAAYTNMPPGEYRFRVKGSNNDGAWNIAGVSLKIIISPPFWQTWWFRILVIILAAAMVVILYRKRLGNERLKIELQTAHDAQMSIMPQTDPQVDGYDISGVCVPANEVGGDFFDYIWMNETQTILGIAVGDVSGKAMKSAMTAVMTSGMIYSKVEEKRSVSDIMRQVNRPLFSKTDRNIFTALCLSAIDLKTRELTFTNAGLPIPLLKPRDAKTINPLRGKGEKMPLGARINTRYQEKRYSLNSGDVVVFYTDGICEAKNLENRFYGDETLATLLRETDLNALSAKEIKNRIIRDVNRFSRGAPQHDDMTVVVLKVY
jgi:serine phosphatase RsbU (regulator of sigma subunit)/ligand-binding sensor domain-containing protein